MVGENVFIRFLMLENSHLATKIFVLSAIANKLAEPYQGSAAILDFGLWGPWAEKFLW